MGPKEKNVVTTSYNAHAAGTLAIERPRKELTRRDCSFLRDNDLTSAQISSIARSFH